MKRISENQIDRLTSLTGEALNSESKLRLTILPDNLGAYWEGGINGHFFRIKTGVEVQVPKSLALLIAQSAAVRIEAQRTVSAFRGNGKRIG